MINMPSKRRTQRGLTLIEVMIVIAILLAIGGLVVVNLLPAKDRADADLTTTQIDQFDAALKMFKLNMGRYPTEDEGLRALWSEEAIEDEEEVANWDGPYLENPIPQDHWGSEWLYRYPGEIRGESFYDIWSQLIQQRLLAVSSIYPEKWMAVDTVEQLLRLHEVPK